MSVYVTYLFYGAIFLSVLLLVEGIFYLLSGPGGGATSPNRRLRMLVGGVKREDVMVRLQRERPLPSGDRARNPVEWFVLLVAQSGVNAVAATHPLVDGRRRRRCGAGRDVRVQVGHCRRIGRRGGWRGRTAAGADRSSDVAA